MAVVAKLKPKSDALAPGSIELNQTTQELDAARFERDAKLHDLTTEFIRRRDEIQRCYVEKIALLSTEE